MDVRDWLISTLLVAPACNTPRTAMPAHPTPVVHTAPDPRPADTVPDAEPAPDQDAKAGTITTSGSLAALVTIEIKTLISGQLVEVLVATNDRVQKGQVLARFDPKPFAVAVTRAKAELDAAVGKRAAKLEIDRLRAVLAEVQLAAQAVTVVSPLDGIVLDRRVDVGQVATATAVLFTVASDLSKLKLDGALAAADIGRVAPGMPVTFTVESYPGRVFRGVVQLVGNAALPGGATYPITITVDNSDLSLKPGMQVSLAITTK